MINRGDYWQCGFVIRKGSFDETRARGLDPFREEAGRLMGLGPLARDDLQSWDDVKLLTVTVDRLKQWYSSGLLCIGDAAHAMSPIGGVGMNQSGDSGCGRGCQYSRTPFRRAAHRRRDSPRSAESSRTAGATNPKAATCPSKSRC
jgi:hypothetical protein